MTHDAHPAHAEMDRLLGRLLSRNARLGADLADAAGNLPRLAANARRRALEELDTAQPDWTLLRTLHRLWRLAEEA